MAQKRLVAPRGRGLGGLAFGLLSSWCLVLAGSALSYAEPPKSTACAIVKAATSAEISTGARELLEIRLVEVPGMTLVERAVIDRIVGELAFSASQQELDLAGRLQLGQLLKADLLIFLSESNKDEERAIGISVADSQTGLQLASGTFLWDEAAPEQTVGSLLDVFSVARKRQEAGIDAVVAVPALECKDRGPSQTHWRRPLATLLQERFLAHDGVLVVELEEAHAFATEFFVGNEGSQLERRLPFYVLGKYSTEWTDDELRFNLELLLRQGDEQIGQEKVTGVLQADLAEELSRLARGMSEKLVDSGHTSLRSDPVQEAATLARRANLFRELGEFDVAIPLYESVVLLDPDHLEARLQLLASLQRLGHSQYLRYIQDSWIPKERSELKLWIAERGIEHLEYVCRKAPLSTEVRNTFRSFRQSAMALRRSAPTRPGAFQGHFLRFCRRREAAYLDLIARLKKEARFDPNAQEYLIKEFGFLVSDASSTDPQAAIASMLRLMHTVGERDQAVTYLVNATTNLALDVEQIAPAEYNDFLAILLESDRRDLRTTGRIARIVATIDSPETKQKALDQMHALPDWQRLAPWQQTWIENGTERCMVQRGRRNGMFPGEERPGVFVPQLTAVPLRLHDAGTLTNCWVSDWVNCEEQGDGIATDAGVFLADGHTARKISDAVAFRLCWDGKWIWAATDSVIEAVNPATGDVVQFELDAVGQERSPDSLLCPIEPGKIAVVDHLFGLYRATRTWVSLLQLTESPQGVSKQSSVIYDARRQSDATLSSRDRTSADEAFRPLWALALNEGSVDATSHLLVGRGESLRVQPLLVNLEDRRAELISAPWPGYGDGFHVYPYAARHADTFYIAMGKIAGGKEWSGVFQTQTLDAVPQMFASFGVRYRSSASLYGQPYFRNGVIYDNVLHLVTTVYPASPHWVAVDLTSGKTSELVTRLPYQYWGEHRLVVSRHSGLVFLARGQAYLTKLPDQSQWSRFPETTSQDTTLRNWPPATD
jgi:tetratricopeptide (TPR) repeat protein